MSTTLTIFFLRLAVFYFLLASCSATISCSCVALLYCMNSVRHIAVPRCLLSGCSRNSTELVEVAAFCRIPRAASFYFGDEQIQPERKEDKRFDLYYSLSGVELYLLNSEQNPEVCDARDDHLCYCCLANKKQRVTKLLLAAIINSAFSLYSLPVHIAVHSRGKRLYVVYQTIVYVHTHSSIRFALPDYPLPMHRLVQLW